MSYDEKIANLEQLGREKFKEFKIIPIMYSNLTGENSGVYFLYKNKMRFIHMPFNFNVSPEDFKILLEEFELAALSQD